MYLVLTPGCTGKLFRYIPCPGKDKSKDFPQSICVDKDGTIWVGTYGAGIYRYSPEQDKFVAYATEALKGDFIFTLCDYGDELIVGVHEEELKRFNKKTGEVSVFPAPEVHRKIIRYAVCFGDELWVGTQNGVYVINEKQNSVQHIPPSPCEASFSPSSPSRQGYVRHTALLLFQE